MGKIIVPLDGSRLSEQILATATTLAWATDSSVLLARVVPTGGTAPAGEVLGAEEALNALAPTLRAAGVAVDTRVTYTDGADVAAKLIEITRAAGATLIAMATHGRDGLGRWLYGSVADAVLRTAPVPVVLVSPTATQRAVVDRPLRIVVPIDGSPASESVVGTLDSVLGGQPAELILVQAIGLPSYVAFESYAYVPFDPDADVAAARTYLDDRAVTWQTSTRPVSVVVEMGEPASVIARVARECEADLIAMATRGRSGVSRFVMGSVATGVIQRAETPMLFVGPAVFAPAAEAADAEPVPGVRLDLSLRDLELIDEGLSLLPTSAGLDTHLIEHVRDLQRRIAAARQDLAVDAAVTRVREPVMMV